MRYSQYHIISSSVEFHGLPLVMLPSKVCGMNSKVLHFSAFCLLVEYNKPITDSTNLLFLNPAFTTTDISIIFYRVTSVSDPLMIGLSIQKYFGRSFTPTQFIVATWSNVGYYDAQRDKVCI